MAFWTVLIYDAKDSVDTEGDTNTSANCKVGSSVVLRTNYLRTMKLEEAGRSGKGPPDAPILKYRYLGIYLTDLSARDVGYVVESGEAGSGFRISKGLF